MRDQRALFRLELIHNIAPAGILSCKLQHALVLHMALHGAVERNVVVVDVDFNVRAAQDRIAAHQVVNGVMYPPVGLSLVPRWRRLRGRLRLRVVMRGRMRVLWLLISSERGERRGENKQRDANHLILLVSPKDSVARLAKRIQCLCWISP